MILVVGSINADICLSVSDIPKPGETVLSSCVSLNSGGKGANQAVAAAKLGGDVVMLGCIGNDENGSFLLNSLKKEKVNTDYIKIADDKKTSTAFIAVSASGENSIIVDSSANNSVTPEYIENHSFLFEKADYCILQMEIPKQSVKTAIDLCKKFGVKVFLNPSPLTCFDNNLLFHVDYLVPNKHEMETLLCKNDFNDDDIFKFMNDYDIKNVIVTLGHKGCCAYSDNSVVFSPSVKCNAVDTTGAGDTFLGALSVAFSKNYEINKALKFANTASGIEVTRSGAQISMPTIEEVNNLM